MFFAGVGVSRHGAGELQIFGMRLAPCRLVQAFGVAGEDFRDAGGVFLRVSLEEGGFLWRQLNCEFSGLHRFDAGNLAEEAALRKQVLARAFQRLARRIRCPQPAPDADVWRRTRIGFRVTRMLRWARLT